MTHRSSARLVTSMFWRYSNNTDLHSISCNLVSYISSKSFCNRREISVTSALVNLPCWPLHDKSCSLHSNSHVSQHKGYSLVLKVNVKEKWINNIGSKWKHVYLCKINQSFEYSHWPYMKMPLLKTSRQQSHTLSFVFIFTFIGQKNCVFENQVIWGIAKPSLEQFSGRLVMPVKSLDNLNLKIVKQSYKYDLFTSIHTSQIAFPMVFLSNEYFMASSKALCAKPTAPAATWRHRQTNL